MELLLDISYWY